MRLAWVSLLIFSITVVVSGCVSHDYRDVWLPQAQALTSDLEAGDTVYIETTSGEEYSFQIENISESAVSGDGISVRFDQIQILRVKEVDVERTLRDSANMTLTVLIVILSIGLAALGS